MVEIVSSDRIAMVKILRVPQRARFWLIAWSWKLLLI